LAVSTNVNIVHFSPTYYSAESVIGGGERFVLYMDKAISAARVEAGIDELTSTLVAFGSVRKEVQLTAHTRLLVEIGEPWNQQTLSAETIRAIASKADVVFVHQCLTPFGLFVAAQAKLLGKRVFGIDHGAGTHPLFHHTEMAGKIFDCFLPYSRFGATAFQGLDCRLEIIEGPVDDHYFTLGNGNRDPTHAVSAGRILPHKGFERIIRALPDHMRLTIVGAKQNSDYLHMLERLSSGRAVEILDAQNDESLRHLLQTAGVYVHASTHVDCYGNYYEKPELLALAAAEALSCGLRALVGSAGALPELARNPGCLCFHSDEELSVMLNELERRSWPSEFAIRSAAVATYGLQQYGNRIWQILKS